VNNRILIYTALLIAGGIVAFIDFNDQYGIKYIGFILILLAFVYKLIFFRCGTCGKYQGRDPGEMCKECGEKL
jgi:hypothetical protein